jgi:hypothetical protein
MFLINQFFHPELVLLDLIRPECILVYTLLAFSENLLLNRAARLSAYCHRAFPSSFVVGLGASLLCYWLIWETLEP